MEVICNVCKSKIIPDLKETKENNLTLMHYMCPHCETGYLISVLDDECNNFQKKIKDIDHRIKMAGKNFATNKISEEKYIQLQKLNFDKKDNLKKELKDRADWLKENIEFVQQGQ